MEPGNQLDISQYGWTGMLVSIWPILTERLNPSLKSFPSLSHSYLPVQADHAE